MSNASTVFAVKGMSCERCVNSIQNAISELEGVMTVAVDLEEKRVVVGYNAGVVSKQTIKETIEDQGYEVE
jgi:copper chaperone